MDAPDALAEGYDSAAIKNKAAQLEAYALVRDDAESQRKFAEIRLRACQRIGELSRDLETVERARTDLRDTDDAQTKTETLANAGINIRTAERYEQLAGGREEQAQQTASAEKTRHLFFKFCRFPETRGF